MSSMREIAKRANVSVATVSRVLNNSGSVSPEVRKRVLACVRELDYVPNALARSLYAKKTNLIALVIPDITNPFFPEIARACEDVANAFGYNLLLCNTDGKASKEKSYITVLRKRQVDGLILLPGGTERAHLEKLVELKQKVVLIDVHYDQFTSVRTDNEKGGYLVTKHLLDLGHDRIGVVAAEWDPKVAGYRQALAEACLSFDPTLLFDITSVSDSNPAEIGARSLLSQDSPPSAILCASDSMATAIYDVADELGLAIPEQLAVAGYDNTTISRALRPRLTTVAQPAYELGRLSAQKLINHIEEVEEDRGEAILLEPRLVVRDSTTVATAVKSR